MLEAIRQLGVIAMASGQDFLEALSLQIPETRGGKEQILMIVKIDTQHNAIEFQPAKIDNAAIQRYAWVGNADGSASPQWYATTNNLNFLVGQSIPNLIKKLPEHTWLRDKLEYIVANMYYDIGPQNGSRNRYRYAWDLEKMGISKVVGTTTVEIYHQIMDKDGDIKKIPDRVASAVLDFIKKQNIVDRNDIALWTIEIDGKAVAEDKAYRSAVEHEKIDVIYENASDGVCSACNSNVKITDNTTKLTFKYYNTDKIGFSSNIEGNFNRNFVLCKDCYAAILEGEAYIKNHFNTMLGGLNLYIIPGFLYEPSLAPNQLDRWAKYINDSFSSAKNAASIEEFEKRIKDDYLEYEDYKNNYILNLMFYQRNQAELKVLKLIKDVPPSRLTLLSRTSTKVGEIGDDLFGPSPMWRIDLSKIYYLIPIDISRNSIEYRKMLDLYDDIFSDKPVSYASLISSFVELARIYRLEQFVNVNIRMPQDNDMAMVYAIAQANLFIEYLRQLKLLERDVPMDYDKLILRDDIKNYIKEMGYDEPKTALFLLGYLIGQVADGQKQSGMDNKPVLDKINYQGMTSIRVWRLSNEIFEKLKQYKRLGYNEGIFAQHKMLMEKNMDNWPLSDQDNVFYMLSGYAYNTLAAIKASKERKEEIVNE